MTPPLSNRLLACCDFVRPGDRVADVGCDHGYLGIHLLKTGTAVSVYESDIAPGPLDSARRNAKKYGTLEKTQFFLSDGVKSVPQDFDTLVCAGMGGDTMVSILEAAPWLKNSRYRLVLQCQSKRPLLRTFLSDQGFIISRETLAQDGKFIYPIMEVSYAPGKTLKEAETYITPALLASRSPLLPDFLAHVLGGIRKAAQYDPHQARLLEELEKIREQKDS